MILDMSNSKTNSGALMYAPDANGSFTPNFIALKPFYNSAIEGEDTTTYMDMAYVYFADTLDDALSKIDADDDIKLGQYPGSLDSWTTITK